MSFKRAFDAWAQPIKVGGRYANPVQGTEKSFQEFLKWRLSRRPGRWPNDIPSPELKSFGPLREGAVELTFINHSSFYLRTKDMGLLFDPVFSNRVSPVSFAGPKRQSALPFELESLPRVDCVCISHGHYDHFDAPTLDRLKKKYDPTFIVPVGHAKYLTNVSPNRVHELTWWQSVEVMPRLQVTLTPAQHWTSRSVIDRNAALWGSFAVEIDGHKIYFAGDTGFGPHFEAIAHKFGRFDWGLLPIGAYEPRWFMKDHHMNPVEALQTHQLLCNQSVACHFGCFALADEGFNDPANMLRDLLLQQKIDTFHIPWNGTSYVL